uniref:Reverse transcriptase domain-containing protein n=1 Tax=Phytophthora ramorum TaxID=164328 RepID=H3GNY1_PHYRM
MVRVNGLLEVAYIADTGADQSVIPSAMADSLRAVQPGLGIVPLDSPISVTLADGSVQVCEMEIVLDLELVTIAGAVNLRAVPCLVLEGEGDEVLLGKDALKRLGIVVDQTLAQLADSTLLEDEEEEYPVGDELPGDASIPITTLDELLDRTVANGLPHEHTTAVRDMLDLFPEIWRDAVSSGAAASVEPLYVRLREDARPYRSPPRKDTPLQAEFIREYVKSLVAEGLVTKNNAARWACAVVPVRKPGSRDKFRFTIDNRPVNWLTIPIAGVMPSTATVMEVLLGKKVFARFDLTHGFWQLPLHPDYQELFSFVTPDGVYTPNCVPQGAMDSALHFQSQMQTLLAPLIPHSALVWVDDVILFAPTVAEFL